MKKLLIGITALLIGAIMGAVWKYPEIKRLNNVNSLFDPDRIVWNFSNMDELFRTRDMQVGELTVLPSDPKPLPEQVRLPGGDRDLEGFLSETDTTSLLVIHDGRVVHESYRQDTDADDQRISWSVAKSFLSALVGRAVEEGSIRSLDDEVVDYVPELAGTAYAGASIRNVLNMASGVRFNEDYFDPKSDINVMGRKLALGGSLDDYAGTLTERAFAPGSANQYVSMDTHVIGMVLREATGESVYDLFEEAFAPVGLGEVTYMTDGEDEAFVLGGLLMTTRAYGNFGELFRRGGEWDGEQIIPADWVAESTVASAPPVYGSDTRGRTYGYQWWSLPDSETVGDYFANGIYGQTIHVYPAMDTVIVKTSADREFSTIGSSGEPVQVEVIQAMRAIAEHYAADSTSP